MTEVTMTEDEITTYGGLGWGAKEWPYNTKINIVKNKGDSQSIGSAVLDRHGIDEPIESLDALLSFITTPFAAPNPVRAVFVSTWSARQDGCYMELLVQAAPPPNVTDDKLSIYLIPSKVQLKLGKDIVTLKPKEVGDFRYLQNPLIYRFYSSILKRYIPSNWYMARNRFLVTPQETKFTTDAPSGKVTLLVTFLTGKSYEVPIGAGTTKLWSEVYAFNTTCKPNQPTRPIVASQQVFRLRKGNELPSPQEFQIADKLTNRYTEKAEVKLTAAERKQRLAFQKSWTKQNEKITRYLGAWKRDEEAVYIYPSRKRNYACVVSERRPGEMDFSIGFVYGGNEMQYSYKDKRTNSLYWRNTPNYLMAKDFGPNLVRPLFATQLTPKLPSKIQSQLEQSNCPTAFVSPTTAQSPSDKASGVDRLLSLLNVPKS